MRQSWIVCGAFGAIVGACGGDDAQAGIEWKGADPHVVLKGTVNAEDLNIDLTEPGKVEVAEVVCEREYAVPVINGADDLSMATLEGFEISATIQVGDEVRMFELDIEGPNLMKLVGKKIEIVPDGSDVADGQAVVEIKWTRVSDEAELLDTDTDTGSITIQEISGAPGEGGVVIADDDGAIGVTGELRFSATEVLNISFTAKCGANDISELVSAP